MQNNAIKNVIAKQYKSISKKCFLIGLCLLATAATASVAIAQNVYVTGPVWGSSFLLSNSTEVAKQNHVAAFDVVDKSVYDTDNEKYRFIYYQINNITDMATPLYYKYTWGTPDKIYGKTNADGTAMSGTVIKYLKWATDPNDNIILNEVIYNEGDVYPGDYSIRIAVTDLMAGLDGRTANTGYVANSLFSGDIKNSYTGLTVTNTTTTNVLGSVITNIGFKLGNISGDFIDNKGSALNTTVYAGAIYNSRGTIGDILGNFIGNTVTGGHIAAAAIGNINSGKIGNISGDFIANGLVPSSGYDGAGAAITNRNGNASNYSYIESITGDFISNYIYSVGGKARGAAIYNMGYGEINFIHGNFIGNYAIGYKDVYGGAINNAAYAESIIGGVINKITGSFVNNYVTSTGSVGFARGGAINNYRGVIETIEGDFLGNSATSTTSSYSSANNYGNSLGGAIVNFNGDTTDTDEGYINKITGNFNDNRAVANGGIAAGGAIYAERANIDSIDGSFIGNYATSTSNQAYGGAIANVEGNVVKSTMSIIDSLFYRNFSTGTASSGGAILNSGTITINNSIFKENYSIATKGGETSSGGAILNYGTMDIYNSSFYNNYSQAITTATGGAIANHLSLNLHALNMDIVFSGNYATDGSGTRQIAIDNEGEINLNALNGYKFVFYDGLAGSGSYNLTSGTMALLGSHANFSSNSTLTVSAGTKITTIDNEINATSLGKLKLEGDINYGLDLDIKTGEGDLLIGEIIKEADGTTKGLIKIDEINILNVTTPNDLTIDLKYLTGSLFEYIGLIEGKVVSSGYQAQSYTNGILTLFKLTNLKDMVNKIGNDRVYELISEEKVISTLGDFGDTDLTVDGQSFNITSQSNTANGMIMKANQEITLNNVGTISGFANYFISATDAKININSQSSNITTFNNAIIGTAEININSAADIGTVNFNANISADAIAIGGGLINFGDINVSATSISGTAINANNTIFNNATISNNIAITSGKTTTFNGTTVNGELSGGGDIISNAAIFGATTIENNIKAGTGITTFNGSIVNSILSGSGSILSNAATFGASTISNAIEIGAGITTFNGTIVSGALSGVGSILSNAATFGASTISNAIEIAAGTTTFNGTTINGALSGSGLIITNSLTTFNTAVANAINIKTGATDFNADVSGALTIDTSAIANANAKLLGAITNNGIINANVNQAFGSISGNGALNIKAGVTSDFNGLISNTISIENKGTINSNVNQSFSSITGGGTLNILSNSNSDFGGSVSNNLVVSAGSFVNANAGSSFSGSITNAGTFNINAQQTFNQTINNTGGIFITNAQTTIKNTFTGGTFNLNNTILNLNGANADLTGTRLVATNGTLNSIDGSIENHDLGSSSFANTNLGIDIKFNLPSGATENDTFTGLATGTMKIENVGVIGINPLENVSGASGSLDIFTDNQSTVKIQGESFTIFGDNYTLTLTENKTDFNELDYNLVAATNSLEIAIESIIASRKYVMTKDESAGIDSPLSGNMIIDGQGLHTISSGSIIMATASTLTLNDVNLAASITNNSTILANNTSFTKNLIGSGIIITTGTTNFSGIEVSNAINVKSDTATFNNTTIKNNISGGGAVVSNGSTFDGSTISTNINVSGSNATTFKDTNIQSTVSSSADLVFVGTNTVNNTISTTKSITNNNSVFNLNADFTLNNSFSWGSFNLFSGKTLTLKDTNADFSNVLFGSQSGKIKASEDGVFDYNLGGNATLTNTAIAIDMTLDFNNNLKVSADSFSGTTSGNVIIDEINFSAIGASQNISGYSGDLILFTDTNSNVGVGISTSLENLYVMTSTYSLMLKGIQNGLNYTFTANPNTLSSAISSVIANREYIMTKEEGAGNVSMTGSMSIDGQGQTVTDGTIKMDATTASSLTLKNVTMGANIVGGTDSTVAINGDINYKETATISNANIILNTAGSLILANDNSIISSTNKNSMTFDGGSLNLANKAYNNIALKNIDLKSNSSLIIDVDLKEEEMDTINADVVTGNANLNITYLNLISDTTKDLVVIKFTTTTDLMGKVIYTGSNPVAYSDLYKYDVAYNNANGEFSFTKQGSGFNPAVQVESVSNQNIYTANLDLGKNLLAAVEAFSPLSNLSSGDSFDDLEGAWTKVYGSNEDVELGSLLVNNKTYAGILGVDLKPEITSKGYVARYSLYAAYLSSTQEYDDVSIEQNGINFGLRAIYNKGYLFSGFVANVGFNLIEGNNMYGDENFETYTASISHKTGYDIDLYNCQYFMQPNLTLSYLYAQTTDYTNASGNKITSNALHVLSINPELKFIAEYSNDYRAYAGISYNWNIEAGGEIKADNVLLPELSVNPYAEYKLGISKQFEDEMAGFIEISATSGGREGYSLQTGLKWNF